MEVFRRKILSLQTYMETVGYVTSGSLNTTTAAKYAFTQNDFRTRCVGRDHRLRQIVACVWTFSLLLARELGPFEVSVREGEGGIPERGPS